jgi:hypothetical protein
MILSLMLLSAVSGQFPAEQCTSAYGQTRCGYGCVSGYGQLKCAATPLGVCKAAYGEVRCWDPDRAVLENATRRTPAAQCLANYGKIACGWSCVANYGEVKCAQTPSGVCVADYGKLHCEDPEPAIRTPPPRMNRAPVPQQQCLSQYGTTVCGYGCVAGYGQVRCSRVPGGVCAAAYGSITCSQ